MVWNSKWGWLTTISSSEPNLWSAWSEYHTIEVDDTVKTQCDRRPGVVVSASTNRVHEGLKKCICRAKTEPSGYETEGC